MSLGEEIRTARSAAGLTQEQLASRAGIDRAYISQLENDHKSPTLATLFLLCGALGVRASELVAKVEPPVTPPKATPGKPRPRPSPKPGRTGSQV